MVRKRMPLVDDELKALGEQRPTVQPVPILVHFDGDAEFGIALFQIFADLFAVAAQQLELKRTKQPLQLLEMRDQQSQVDSVCDRNPERADLATLERRCQRSRADGSLIALLQQRLHALS